MCTARWVGASCRAQQSSIAGEAVPDRRPDWWTLYQCGTRDLDRCKCARVFLGSRPPGPNGASAIVFVAVWFCCFRRKAILPTAEHLAFRAVHRRRVVCAAAIKFAMLQRCKRPGLCAAWVSSSCRRLCNGRDRQPIVTALHNAWTFNLKPLSRHNEMNYDANIKFRACNRSSCGVAQMAFAVASVVAGPSSA